MVQGNFSIRVKRKIKVKLGHMGGGGGGLHSTEVAFLLFTQQPRV